MVPKEKVAIEIIGLSSISIYEAWLAEDRIQKIHGAKYRHLPKIEGFSNREMRIGPTECFSQPLSEELMTLFFQNNTRVTTLVVSNCTLDCSLPIKSF